MAKYYVDVEHTNSYRISIEADNDKAASKKVSEMIQHAHRWLHQLTYVKDCPEEELFIFVEKEPASED